jgi:hypothetical protein
MLPELSSRQNLTETVNRGRRFSALAISLVSIAAILF